MRCCLKQLGLIVVAISAVVSGHVATGASPSSKDSEGQQPSGLSIIGEAKEASDNACVAMTIEASYRRTVRPSSESPDEMKSINFLYRERDRLDLRCFSPSAEDASSVDQTRPGYRTLILSDSVFTYRMPTPGKPPFYIKYGATSGKQELLREWSNPAIGQFLNGRLPGTNGQSIFDLVDPASAKSTSDVVDGLPCDRIESKTAYGVLVLWISRARGNCLVEASLTTNSTDKWDVVPDDSGVLSRLTGPDGFGAVTKCQQNVHATDFKQIGNRWVSVAGRYTQEMHYTSGKIALEEDECRRTDIQTKPDFKALGAFDLSGVPDGTRVETQAAVRKGLFYELRQGRVVPAIDEHIINHIQATTRSLLDDSGR